MLLERRQIRHLRLASKEKQNNWRFQKSRKWQQALLSNREFSYKRDLLFQPKANISIAIAIITSITQIIVPPHPRAPSKNSPPLHHVISPHVPIIIKNPIRILNILLLLFKYIKSRLDCSSCYLRLWELPESVERATLPANAYITIKHSYIGIQDVSYTSHRRVLLRLDRHTEFLTFKVAKHKA